jgi:hypothetical protein
MARTRRRQFIVRSVAGGCALVATGFPILALAAGHVEETDETAAALGYKHDTHAVDPSKYPQHTVAQRCVECSFFQGAPTDAWGGCAMFGRKQVAAEGWCSAFAKKPG